MGPTHLNRNVPPSSLSTLKSHPSHPIPSHPIPLLSTVSIINPISYTYIHTHRSRAGSVIAAMVELGKTVLNKGWLAARSTEVDLTGIQLTTTHPPSLSVPWMDAHLPGT